MAAAARAPDDMREKELLWKKHAHSDVKKDNNRDYDARIVNSFLPSPGGDPPIDKNNLFNEVVKGDEGEVYPTMLNTTIGRTKEVFIPLTNKRYSVKGFDLTRDLAPVIQIKAFLGAHKIALFIDGSIVFTNKFLFVNGVTDLF